MRACAAATSTARSRFAGSTSNDARTRSPALLLTGSILGQSSQPERALPFLHRAARLEPRNAAVRNDLGLVHLALGDSVRAREAFEAALARAPRLAAAHFNLARLMMNAQRLEEAERHFRMAIEGNPNLLDARAGLAELLSHGARTEEATALCRQILAARTGHPGSLPHSGQHRLSC